MMFEKLTHRVRTIDFETVSGATELLEQTKIVEGSADEHKLHIELLSRLAPISFAQKNTRCEWLINTGVLNSRSNPVASRVILVSGPRTATC